MRWLLVPCAWLLLGRAALAQVDDSRLTTAGPPVTDAAGVLLRFQPPKDLDLHRVYLAGNFNQWANNRDGAIDNPRHAMQRAPSGVWYTWVDAPGESLRYQFVVETTGGDFRWFTDPFVKGRDADGNTQLALDVSAAATTSQENTDWPAPSFPLAAERVWVAPDEPNALMVPCKDNEAQLRTTITTPFGEAVYTATQDAQPGINRIKIPGIEQPGGYLARVDVIEDGAVTASATVVLSVVENVADDLRYGFYATYTEPTGNYDAKAAMLAGLHINAVEFYDYFPAHGDYAPDKPAYVFEPFNVAICALDIQAKIDAGHRRNLLAIAYIAAYAASESVYRTVPDPMTDAAGSPKVFNGGITTEAEADRKGQQKWFWLMNIARGSQWHRYILANLQKALREDDDDYAAFDGFEIDTYGDSREARFHAPGSPRDGDLLADVLQDYVEDVTTLTHSIKPHGLVSFNSVNEFGVENMYPVTDFLFLEIWRGHADRLEQLVDICYYHRQARNQRVVLKLYPADMQPARDAWPHVTLARLLGAAMTGGGSLMVVGEPDETTGTMHALNSLYYPDHQPMSAENEDLLRRYYQLDALLYGYTHGREVRNLPQRVPLTGCITRLFLAREKSALCLQILQVGNDPAWTALPKDFPMRKDVGVAIPLPESVAPTAVCFASPDVPEFQIPQALPFTFEDGAVHVTLPTLGVHGSVIVRYADES